MCGNSWRSFSHISMKPTGITDHSFLWHKWVMILRWHPWAEDHGSVFNLPFRMATWNGVAFLCDFSERIQECFCHEYQTEHPHPHTKNVCAQLNTLHKLTHNKSWKGGAISTWNYNISFGTKVKVAAGFCVCSWTKCAVGQMCVVGKW